VTINIKKNTLWVLSEVICSALILFIVYGVVVHRLGIGSLGIWSLVVAATSLVRVVDPGTSAGLGRFIAVANARGQTREIGDYFVTALVSTFSFYAILSGFVFWPLKDGLRFALSGSGLEIARDLLPYAIVSFLLTNCNGAIQGALIGLQRSDLKSQIVIGGLVLQLILVLVLISESGLKGLAQAQILQYCFGIVVGYLMVVRHIRGRIAWWFPFAWKRATFAELWSFGLRLQAISIISFLWEPVSKFVISSVAGVETLGFFEMAQKFIQQGRQLVVAPTTILMPAFAHLNDRAPNELATLYSRSLAAAIVIGSSLMGVAAMSSPVVSVLWLGHLESRFVIFVMIMSAAWLVNIIASPVYVLAVSIGLLKWNFWGAVVTSAGSPLLALTIGKSFGPIGVVSATMLALAAGSLFSMIMNCRYAAMPVWTKLSNLRDFIICDLVRLIPFPVGARKS
jgi:O-antigen/teichoic acid export membrane protein